MEPLHGRLATGVGRSETKKIEEREREELKQRKEEVVEENEKKEKKDRGEARYSEVSCRTQTLEPLRCVR